MSDEKDKAKEKKAQEKQEHKGSGEEAETGYGKSGGNMGAGQSGKEGLGVEKPTDGGQAGSQKPE